jgi:hypothetical protein
VDRLHTVAVESDAQLPHGPEVRGVAALKRHLLEQRRDDIAENLIRKLLTYGLGRELTWRDRPTVDILVQHAEQNDYRLEDILVHLCQTELFLGGNDK